MELAAKGVRVNSVNPGFIETDFYNCFGAEVGSDAYNALASKAGSNHPVQRIGYTDDCVNAIAFLAKDSSSFVTGIILPVDGGVSTKGVFL